MNLKAFMVQLFRKKPDNWYFFDRVRFRKLHWLTYILYFWKVKSNFVLWCGYVWRRFVTEQQTTRKLNERQKHEILEIKNAIFCSTSFVLCGPSLNCDWTSACRLFRSDKSRIKVTEKGSRCRLFPAVVQKQLFSWSDTWTISFQNHYGTSSKQVFITYPDIHHCKIIITNQSWSITKTYGRLYSWNYS